MAKNDGWVDRKVRIRPQPMSVSGGRVVVDDTGTPIDATNLPVAWLLDVQGPTGEPVMVAVLDSDRKTRLGIKEPRETQGVLFAVTEDDLVAMAKGQITDDIKAQAEAFQSSVAAEKVSEKVVDGSEGPPTKPV